MLQSRYGQMSIEHVLIVAFTIALLIPLVYVYYTYTTDDSGELAGAQYNRLGQEMLSTAAKARDQGPGAWLTLDANVPENIVDITVDAPGELVITYDTGVGTSEMVFFTETPLSAHLTGMQQNGSVYAGDPHQGVARFRFTTGDTGLVAISEVT